MEASLEETICSCFFSRRNSFSLIDILGEEGIMKYIKQLRIVGSTLSLHVVVFAQSVVVGNTLRSSNVNLLSLVEIECIL